MAQVKVWNDNKYTYTEMFKGQEIKIRPGQFIVMDEDDAIDFRGKFVEIKEGADGKQDPHTYKMIRVETTPLDKDVAAELRKKQNQELTCQKCGYVALSAKMLEEHIDLNHLEDLDDQSLADKRKEEVVAKKRPGRPKKEEAQVESAGNG